MKTFHVETIKKIDEQYIGLIPEIPQSDILDSLKDGERMIVDSDKKAFIYILEDETKLYYVYFKEDLWETLREIYEQKLNLYIQFNEKPNLQLKAINVEIGYLIENIKGNGNYGEEMERAVQRVFG